MFEFIFIIILALFAIGGIWAFAVSKKAVKEGIETDAVISRIELHEWSGIEDECPIDSVTEECYITYRNHNGQNVEAILSNPGDHTFKVGDRIQVRYLPDRQDYPVMTKTL